MDSIIINNIAHSQFFNFPSLSIGDCIVIVNNNILLKQYELVSIIDIEEENINQYRNWNVLKETNIVFLSHLSSKETRAYFDLLHLQTGDNIIGTRDIS